MSIPMSILMSLFSAPATHIFSIAGRTRTRARHGVATLTACATLLIGTLGISNDARAWPDHPVKIITLAGPGGGSDAVVRIISDGLSKEWSKPVVIENKPGADGIIAVDAFLGTHDGHTLLFASTGTVTANPLLHPKLSYDPVRDLAPVSLAVEDFIAVTARPDLAATLPDLVKIARERQDTLNYATVPGPPFLFALALQSAAKFKMSLIFYKNPLAAIQDETTSRIDVSMMPLASVLELGKAKKLNILAVTNPKRSPTAPEIPTVAEAGFGEIGFFGGLGFFAPNDMSPEQREKIAADIRRIINTPETKQRLEQIGYVVRGEGPEAFKTILQQQSTKWADLLRLYNINPLE